VGRPYRIGSPRVQAKNWRLMAFGCLTLALLMAGGLVWRSAQSIVTPYVVEVDNAGQVRAVGEAATPYRPGDAQTAHHIARFVTLVRSLSIDPIVVRQNWLDAYDYTTDKGAAVLNDYARVNDPFARIGNLALPASPYQVMAGTVIAGALVTGIKSDLPGDVIATVTEPVYDTATGKFLLIPQGSRILGKYNSQVSYGQSRVQVVWNRVILPDTSSLTLDNLVGTDPAGYAGLEDDVDWHWSRIVAGAVLTTLLGVGAELAAPENRQDGNRIVIAGRDSAQDSINQVGQEITRRNMNIQPTLTTRPGLPIRIIVNRDLVLRPYQPMFFQRGAMQ
jgi:hypothetical protein